MDFRYKTTTTDEVVAYLSQSFDKDLTAFFDQYLKHSDIPTLVFKEAKEGFYYKWEADVKHFEMPIRVKIKGEEQWIFPKATGWSLIELKGQEDFEWDKRLFLVNVDFN